MRATSFSPVTSPGGRCVSIVHKGLLRSSKLSDQLQGHSLWLQPVTTPLCVSMTWATAAVCCPGRCSHRAVSAGGWLGGGVAQKGPGAGPRALQGHPLHSGPSRTPSQSRCWAQLPCPGAWGSGLSSIGSAARRVERCHLPHRRTEGRLGACLPVTLGGWGQLLLLHAAQPLQTEPLFIVCNLPRRSPDAFRRSRWLWKA